MSYVSWTEVATFPDKFKSLENSKLNVTGGTLSGNVQMGQHLISTSSNPTTNDHLARKGYVDNAIASVTGNIDLTNYVTLNSDQTITGKKRFHSDMTVNLASPSLDVMGTSATGTASVYLTNPEGNASNRRKTAIVAEGTGSFSRSKLHMCLNNNADHATQVSVADSKLTIDPNGNVGINTTAPTYTLDVNGNARFQQAVSANQGIQLNNSKIMGMGNGSANTDATTVQQVILRNGNNAMQGTLNMNSNKITNVLAGNSANDAVTYEQVVLKDGTSSMSANLNMGGFKTVSMANGTNSLDGVNVQQTVLRDGTNSMTANLNMGGFKITNVANGTNGTDAATINQVMVKTQANIVNNAFTLHYANPRLEISGTHEDQNATIFLTTPWTRNIGVPLDNFRKTAIIAQGLTTYSRSNLCFCLRSASDNASDVTLADTRMCIHHTGEIGIGTGTNKPATRFQVTGGESTFDNLILNAATASTPASSNVNDRTNTYITFNAAGATTDHAYLRQIGSDNAMHLAFDFHDDGVSGNDGRFSLRTVQSTGTLIPAKTFFSATADGTFVNNPKSTVSLSPSLSISNDGTYTHGIWFVSNSSPGAWNPMVQSGDKSIMFSSNAANTSALVIGPWANTEQTGGLKIDGTNGNVSIGKSSASEKLDVNGNAIIRGHLTTANWTSGQLIKTTLYNKYTNEFGAYAGSLVNSGEKIITALNIWKTLKFTCLNNPATSFLVVEVSAVYNVPGSGNDYVYVYVQDITASNNVEYVHNAVQLFKAVGDSGSLFPILCSYVPTTALASNLRTITIALECTTSNIEMGTNWTARISEYKL